MPSLSSPTKTAQPNVFYLDDDLPSTKRQRIFGSDAGDIDGEMCGSMLQVVFDLFDGIDYEDP